MDLGLGKWCGQFLGSARPHGSAGLQLDKFGLSFLNFNNVSVLMKCEENTELQAALTGPARSPLYNCNKVSLW